MSTKKRNTHAGSRRRVPADALKACAECGTPRGTRRRDWNPILAQGTVVGFTCPQCPEWLEPIRREVKRDGVRFVAMVRDLEGKQVKTTHHTLEAARRWVADRREAAQTGFSAPPPGETVSELIARWLGTRFDVRPITVEGYASVLRAVDRRIGKIQVEDVTPATVQTLTTWLSTNGGQATKAHPNGRPLSPRSVQLALTALAQAFDMADLPTNPVRSKAIRKPRRRERVGTDLEHWQPSDLLKFRDHADTDPLAGVWRLTLSGLTRADVLGLRWSDVDFEAGTVTIRQGRVPVEGGRTSVIDAPKSTQRRRVVPFEVIHPGTTALLRALKAKQAADKLAAGGRAWRDTGLVVVNEIGEPVRPEWYSDRFRAVARSAGVPSIKLHSVRHSLAFWLHSVGVTPADAAAFLGHTVDVHLSTYLPESGNAGVSRASLALAQAAAVAVSE